MEGCGKGLIVVPAFNEEDTIGGVLREIREEDLGCEIVVVDDGSSDGTGRVTRSLRVSLLSHPVNIGYGAAVQTGFKYAVREGVDFLVLMDADGQHVPSQIPMLLEGLRNGGDLVIGSRFVEGGVPGYRVPWSRRIGIGMFSALAWLLGGVRIRDVTSGFQAMRRPVFCALAEEYPIDFPDAEVIIMLSRRKFRVVEVPVLVRGRRGGRSMYSGVGTLLYYPFKCALASFIVMLRLLRGGRKGE